MHDFHRLRFSTHRRQRLRGLSLVALGWLSGFFGPSLLTETSFASSMLAPITTGILTAFLLDQGARFRTHSVAAATESLHFGSVVSVRPRQVLLGDVISVSAIAHALGNHFLLRRTLKPVHFESI